MTNQQVGSLKRTHAYNYTDYTWCLGCSWGSLSWVCTFPMVIPKGCSLYVLSSKHIQLWRNRPGRRLLYACGPSKTTSFLFVLHVQPILTLSKPS